MIDPIVDEVRRAREAHAARFDFDLDAIFNDIKDQEKKSGRKIVNFAHHPKDHSVETPTTNSIPPETELTNPPVSAK